MTWRGTRALPTRLDFVWVTQRWIFEYFFSSFYNFAHEMFDRLDDVFVNPMEYTVLIATDHHAEITSLTLEQDLRSGHHPLRDEFRLDLEVDGFGDDGSWG